MTPPEMGIVGNSTFVVHGRGTGGKVVIGRKSDETIGVAQSVEMSAIDLDVQHVLSSERQSAE